MLVVAGIWYNSNYGGWSLLLMLVVVVVEMERGALVSLVFRVLLLVLFFLFLVQRSCVC